MRMRALYVVVGSAVGLVTGSIIFGMVKGVAWMMGYGGLFGWIQWIVVCVVVALISCWFMWQEDHP
jgi:hypothetical protein